MSEKVLIIGSGPAGLTAAIYTARANLSPVVIEGFMVGGSAGGQLMTTDMVENYPGFPDGVYGPDLIQKMKEQATRFNTRFISEDVEEADLSSRPFKIKTQSGQIIESETLIIATGATARRLPIDSEKKFWGKGISACAVCDGGLPIFRNKEMAVIGGGDTAVEEAVHLTQFGSKIYIIHRRDELRASQILRDRATKHPKIEILWNKVVEEFLGDDLLSGIKLKDTKTGEFSDLSVVGAFEAIGHIPNTGFLKGQVETDKIGYIVPIVRCTKTSVEGVFAAGDVADPDYRQAVSATGTGCMAAIDAEHWLQDKGIV